MISAAAIAPSLVAGREILVLGEAPRESRREKIAGARRIDDGFNRKGGHAPLVSPSRRHSLFRIV